MTGIARLMVAAWAVLAALTAAPAGAGGPEWRLMDRHGGCATLAEAGRRKAALEGVVDPDGFAAKMRDAGRTVSVTELPLARGSARLVEVPAEGLSLIFVPATACDGPPSPPR